jgi:hypothetical protein
MLRRDSSVEKGPLWPATASEVTGGRRSGGGGVLKRGVLRGPEETTVELSAASMPEQGKRKARQSRLGRARKGKRGGPVRATPRGGRGRMGPGIPAATRERLRRELVGRCSASCGSRGAGDVRGLRMSAWAIRGKEGAGPGPREQ